MRVVFLLSLAAVLSVSGSCNCQSADGIASAVASQWSTLSRQVSLAQGILTELSRSVAGVVTGPSDASSSDALTSSLTAIAGQLSSLRHALDSVSVQAQRVFDSGSRVITGQPLASPQISESPAEPSGTTPASSEVSSSNATAAAPAESTPDNSTSPAGLKEGPSAGNEPHEWGAASGPSALLVRTVDAASKQLSQVTYVVEQLSRQMSRLLATGARTLEANRLNPTDTVLDAVAESLKQLTQLERSVRAMNSQFNRMVDTGTRSVFGEGHRTHRMLRSHRHKRADQAVITGLQKAATELTRELGQIGGTLSRIASGMSGVRLPGLGSSSRSIFDNSTSVFQGLNPVGVLSRGFGNLASTLSRVVPQSG